MTVRELVSYEWVIETVDTESEDILDVNHTNTYSEALTDAAGRPDKGCFYRIGLVRDDDDGRSWAYVEDGVLPSHFEDAMNCPVAKVPQKIRKQFDKATK